MEDANPCIGKLLEAWTPPPPLGFAQIKFDTVVRYSFVTLTSVCWDQKAELSLFFFFGIKSMVAKTARIPRGLIRLKLKQR